MHPYKTIDLEAFPPVERKRIETALLAAETQLASQHFVATNVSHAKVQGEYVYLYMSPVAVLEDEAWKVACEVHVPQKGGATSSRWFTGRANVAPERSSEISKLYDKRGYYQPAASHDAILANVDKALRSVAMLRARIRGGDPLHLHEGETLDGNIVNVGTFPGGLSDLAARRLTYVLAGAKEHTVQSMLYDDDHQRCDFMVDARTHTIVSATRWTLKRATR